MSSAATEAWLSEPVFGIARSSFIIVVVCLVLFLLMPCLVGLVCRPFRKNARKTPGALDDLVTTKMPTPTIILLQGLLLLFALHFARLPTEVHTIVEPFVWFYAILGALWFSSRALDLINYTMSTVSRRLKLPSGATDTNVSPFVGRLLKILAMATILIVALQVLGLPVTSLITALGIGGLAVGLATQPTLSNLFASAVVFTDHPFEVGDYVKIGTVEGTVEEVGLRSLRVRQFDSSLVIVPNARLETDLITNYFRSKTQRLMFSIQVDTAGDIDGFLAAARGMVQQFPGLKECPEPWTNVYLKATDGRRATIEFKVFLAVGPMSSEQSSRLIVSALTKDVKINYEALATGSSQAREASGGRQRRSKRPEGGAGGADSSEAIKAKINKADEKHAEGATEKEAELDAQQTLTGEGVVVEVSPEERARQVVRASWAFWPAYLLLREKFSLEVLNLLKVHNIHIPGEIRTVETKSI